MAQGQVSAMTSKEKPHWAQCCPLSSAALPAAKGRPKTPSTHNAASEGQTQTLAGNRSKRGKPGCSLRPAYLCHPR